MLSSVFLKNQHFLFMLTLIQNNLKHNEIELSQLLVSSFLIFYYHLQNYR